MKLSQAIGLYEMHMRARGLSRSTQKGNLQPLNRALRVWGDLDVDQIRPEHVDMLFMDGAWSPATQNLYLTVLRGGFFKWCRVHGHMPRDFDPTEGWRNVRVATREKFWLPVEEFPDLLDAAACERDRAVIAIGMFTLMRGSEIRTLRIRDVDFDRGEVSMYRHKTKQADVLPLTNELNRELVTWLNYYRHRMGRLEPDWFLTPARGPLPMTWNEAAGKLQPTGEPASIRPTTVYGKPYEAVKRALRALGHDDSHQGVHSTRRAAARALFDRLRSEGYEGSLMRVSSLLGHANVVTTERYLGLGIEKAQRNELLANKDMFPGLGKGKVVRLEARHG